MAQMFSLVLIHLLSLSLLSENRLAANPGRAPPQAGPSSLPLSLRLSAPGEGPSRCLLREAGGLERFRGERFKRIQELSVMFLCALLMELFALQRKNAEELQQLIREEHRAISMLKQPSSMGLAP